MKQRTRIVSIIFMTFLLGSVIAFLLYSSEDPHWGGGFWEEWLARHFDWPQEFISQLVFNVRKSMHFTGYGGIGLLFWAYFYLWRLPFPQGAGLLATAAVASLDEYTQSFATFRSGQPQDVLLDICGALAIGLIVRLVLARRKPRRPGSY